MFGTIATVLAGMGGAGIIFMVARAFWAPQTAVGCSPQPDGPVSN
ncbi:hypothetical protein ACIBH1_48130 [Nonomuraea sp. NPDC050663]